MSNYDFRSLSPADFEELVRDLVQAELEVRLESFSTGRDTGVDLRFATNPDQALIVQCKHYAQSGYRKLHRVLRNEELPKIRRLSPARYYLFTSVGLTPNRKDELFNLLHPFCNSPADIFGGEDVNNLLGRHQEVEEKHHKLWLTSQAVLQRVLHNATFLQTELEREAISRRLSLYVQTEAFDRARAILQHNNYCIISGIPGIGKTTLAEILIIHLLEAGFDLLVATNSISEALQLFRSDRRQTIYYDDFLGRSSFGEKLEKNEDRSLLRLLKEVRGSSSKKLILTTREYILSQAKQAYELLSDRDLDIGKCIIQLDDYSRYDRARILYNHLYFFNVPAPHIDALVADRHYRKIIDHPNFSPLIIEWMTSAISFEKFGPTNYASEFLENLDNPGRLWGHAFDYEISSDARQILLLLGCMPDTSPLDCVQSALNIPDATGPGERARRFSQALKEIDGTFVRTLPSREEIYIEFHNPSISDFVRQRMGRDARLCEELVAEARYFEQLDVLLRLTSSGSVARTATGLVSDEEVISDAISRVIDSETASVTHLQAGSDQRIITLSDSTGSRLGRVCAWAVALNCAKLHESVLSIARSVCSEDEIGRQSVGSLAALLKAVDRSALATSADVSGLADGIALAAMRELDSFPSGDEWVAWSEAVETARSRLAPGRLEALRDLAEAFCRSECEAILLNASTRYEATSEADNLETVAQSWDIPFDEELEDLQESIVEQFPEEPEEDDELAAGSRVEGGESDGAIDSLFDSLRQ